tara:strand:+ start:14782 stop:15399 length:618 start_codon:yes stop_codon:yes gene_type:complete
MQKILNLEKIENSIVDRDYFPFFHIQDSISDSYFKEIIENFPDFKSGGSFPYTKGVGSKHLDMLITELQSKGFRSILEKKLEVDLSGKEVITTLRGFSRSRDGKIHTDSKSKIVTVLLYLNSKWTSNQGHLRMLKNNYDLEDYIFEVPCSFGSMVAFKVTDNCWHGFLPYEGKRLSIQMNYVMPKSLKIHNFRHNLSHFIKKIFR